MRSRKHRSAERRAFNRFMFTGLAGAVVWTIAGFIVLPPNAPIGLVMAPAGALYGTIVLRDWIYQP